MAWATWTNPIVPQRPWAHRPGWSFLPAGAGTQVPPSDTASFPIFPYEEAIEYAREHAEGLDRFPADHGRILFMDAGQVSGSRD